jgi:predicted CoA-binding protein
MKVSKGQIQDFFNNKSLAIAGVSRNEKKFGNVIFKELIKKEYKVIPVNPNTKEIDGHKCYRSVEDIPSDVNSLLITTPKKQTDEVLKIAIQKGIRNIWVQQMSETEETLKIASEYGKEIIHHKCIFMFAEPVSGLHKFHRTLNKLFGKLPK